MASNSSWVTFCDFFLSKEEQIQKQIDKYLEMAFHNRLNYKWQLAAENYYNVFEKLIELGDNNDALRNLLLSGECYENCNMIVDAIDAYTMCSEMYLRIGDIIKTADVIAKIGKLYETIDKYKSIEFYCKAVNYYKASSNFYGQRTNLEKIYQIHLENENFEDAIKKINELIELLLKHNDKYNVMRKYTMPDIYFNILLCYLVVDIIAFKKAMQQYYECDDFYKTIEYNFLEELGNAYENYNLDDFHKVVSEYREIKNMKPWQNKCLEKLYQNMNDDDHEEDLT